MDNLNHSIDVFLESHQYMTVACIDDNLHPYCFNCFYFYDKKKKVFIFSSSKLGTRHVPLLYKNHRISGSVLPNCMPLDTIIGLQFTGDIILPGDVDEALAQKYLKNYPIALKMPHDVWGIEIEYIKLTDNSKGFGNKKIWEKKI